MLPEFRICCCFTGVTDSSSKITVSVIQCAAPSIINGSSGQLLLKTTAILLRRCARRRFSRFLDSLPSGIPAEEQCGASDWLVSR